MELILSICLISSPLDCREEHISVSLERSDSMTCMITAPPMIAEWSNVHPKWKVVKWRCGPAGFDGKKI
jgi:hypothetical protein